MSGGRLWLALVLALFCLPLFIGLGRADVQDDEAIYSFGVDRLLESGDWLAPKSSPHENAAFLEKPPLKFWIVGLPIRLGLLPHSEFGIRFWDALFGGLGFVYVFLLGVRLAGPVAGTVAVMLLFVHVPLVFEHGLRTNNMEAALFLCYCGGIYHYLRWAHPEADPLAPAPGGRLQVHAGAVGLYFVLGFMTKFVAALFLPLTIGLVTLTAPAVRARLARDRRLWLAVAGLVVALCTPWFVYAQWRFGSDLWTIILAEHVYTRFTTYLNPEHVQPWHYYVSTMYLRFRDSNVHVLVAAGLFVLAVQTIRRRWVDGLVVLLWFALPVVLISFGTSKLYHYAYPFLPPLALAAGYLAGLTLALAPAPLARAWDEYVAGRLPARLGRPAARRALLALASASFLIAIVSLFYGSVRLRIGGADVFRNSGGLRPALVTFVSGALAGAPRGAARASMAVLIATLLPAAAYHDTWRRLRSDVSPKRDAIDCIHEVARKTGGQGRGLYLDLPDRVIGHPLYYYFRRVRPWTRAPTPAPEKFPTYLTDEAEMRPILTWEEGYRGFRSLQERAGRAESGPASIPMLKFGDDVVLLLPGPYAVCSADAARPARRL